MISIFYNNNISKKDYGKLSKDTEVLFELEGLCKENIDSKNVFTNENLEKFLKGSDFSFKKVLYIDLFLKENEFLKKVKVLTKDFLSLFDAIRVEDIGLAFFLKEKFPKIKLQIILENFCHSVESIKTINKEFKSNIDKIIISSELEKDTVKKIIKEKVNIEVLLFGNILIFQTPRNLLGLKSKDTKTSLLSSKEIQDHSNLTFKANKNGCFIFNDKIFNILKDTKKLEKEGIKNFRIDTRFLGKKENKELIDCIINKKDKTLLFPKIPYEPLFFYNNDSDKLFKNLKRKTYFELPKAEVLSTISGKWATIYVFKDFKTSDKFSYKTQDGSFLQGETLEAYSMDDKKQTHLKKNKVYYIKWQRKIFAGSEIV